MPKIITCGQGGAILTNNHNLHEKIELLKNFGRTSGGNDYHGALGFNFKLTEPQSILGRSQLMDLPRRVKRKKEIYLRYKEELSFIPGEKLYLVDNNIEYTAPWFFEVIASDREALQSFLKELGIESRIMYPPINKQPIYNEENNFPVSNKIGKRGLWLPSFVQITDEEISYVCRAIKKFYD
jgi:perosamine synthetase